jgi:hypothetical protein
MKLNDTFNEGLFSTLDRFAGTTKLSYPYKQKILDINDALDWYLGLAFEAGLGWEFDDINQTSPPIDSQSIVSGTNRYKFSAFTEKIINLIRLEILDSAGKGHALIPETFETLGAPTIGAASGQISGISSDTFQERYLNPASSGLPTHYIKYGDYIYLYPSPNYSLSSALKAYFNRPALKYSFISISSINTGSEVFTASSAHGFSAGDTVIFATDGTLPTGLTSVATAEDGTTYSQQYYVLSGSLTTTNFTVSTVAGGSAVNITDAQTSSNHSFIRTNGEPGINSMHHVALCRRASLSYRSLPANSGSQATLSALFAQVQKDEEMIRNYFALRDKDVKKRITGGYQNNH